MSTVTASFPTQVLEVESGDGTYDAADDPFTTSSTQAPRSYQQRYSSFNPQGFTLDHPSSSPAQAKRALEAHIVETDRRLQETSKLGTALIQQRKDLNDRLRDVEMHYSQGEIGPELRQKLISLEKEFHEAGRGNTRASIASKPRLRNPDEVPNGSHAQDLKNTASPSKFSSQATDSPSKVSVPSRRQRNQPSSGVHDIEFLTELGTSLLAQVRQLQNEAVEREEMLKAVSLEKSRLELEAEGFSQRLRSLDESEQRYKDENWSLETQTHNLIAAAKEAADRQQRLQQTINSLSSEKSAALRELDDLKQAYMKIIEDHVTFRRNYDSELSNLRKVLAQGDHDRGALQRRIEELTSQNQELARAVAGRFRSEEDPAVRDLGSEPEELSLDRSEPERSPPPSPSKGAVRHTMLESETLRSSLHHAYRMIQNLKSNIHREKAEKLELKRMLQESRDEIELRRSESGGANHTNKRLKGRSQEDVAKKLIRPNALGTSRNRKTDIEVNEAEWEDQSSDGPVPSNASDSLAAGPSLGPSKPRDASDAYQTANETEEAFETANERDTATETDAFQTGAESMAEDSSDGLTETEGGNPRNATTGGASYTSLSGSNAGNRSSFNSTASTSTSEEESEVKTPIQAQPQRYRLRLNRGSRRSQMGSEGIVSSNQGSMKNSPASFVSTNGKKGQSLFAELGELNGEEIGEDADGTPSRASIISQQSTPNTRQPDARQSVVHSTEINEPSVPRSSMVDSSMMTDPWVVESLADYKDELGRPLDTRPNSKVEATTSQVGLLTPHAKDIRSQQNPMTNSPPLTLASSAVSTPRKIWDQPFESFAGRFPTFGPVLMLSSSGQSTPSHNGKDDESSRALEREIAPISTSLGSATHDLDPVSSENQQKSPIQTKNRTTAVLPSLSFSSIQSIETRPVAAKPNLPPRDSRRLTATEDTPDVSIASYDAGAEHIQQNGMLGSILGWTGLGRQLMPPKTEDESRDESESESESQKSHSLSQRASTDVEQQHSDSSDFSTIDQRVKTIRSSDQSSQTILSVDQIDILLIERSAKSLPIITDNSHKRPSMMRPLADIGALASTIKKNHSHESLTSLPKIPGKLMEPAALREAAPLVRSVKRSGSSGSIRTASGAYPPLPPDHQKAIAAAQRAPASDVIPTVMGPPALPASAYRSASNKPRTPTEQRSASVASKTATIPRTRYSTTRSHVSRRSSVTSFASELDERFNIRTDGMPMPQGLETGTDPRMIQAITQTMIGEYLWKYTRKPGRGEMSDKRHRRFFWVHPYTRTLYWSEQDPSTAGRAQLKAKSVAIDTIRVVTDDNPLPPGLHRKSLIVVTPGRDVKFTATTGQRHETWFNALSYLLLRTGADAPSYDPAALTADDVAEFNPPYRGQGTGRRAAGSRQSLASYASRVSNRGSRPGSRGPSPIRNQSSLSANQLPESAHPPASTTSRHSQQMSHAPPGSFSSRFSSYWRQDRRSVQGSMSSQRSKSSQPPVNRSLETGRIHDSAEDLRQMMEKPEQDSDRLENADTMLAR
ncbi:MAG: hypothetical protein Q9187_000020 [Circinaria calcarea]